MPNYDYKCSKCGQVIDLKVKVDERDIIVIKCPNCQNIMKRIITMPAILFRGAGWSKDGYDKRNKEVK